MAQKKRTRWIALAPSFPVSWTCLRADRSPGSTAGVPWQRMVTIEGREADGREVMLPLSPAEARALGERLIKVADSIDATNAQHGNGFPIDPASVTA